ncbi:MAG: hypothetical protein HQK84_07330 [Nitrospinae bacterium]|nr:hypothetical protein [Nitrospinota bacterium]
MSTQDLINSLKQTIAKRDLKAFNYDHYRLTNVCIKSMIESDRELMKILEKGLPPLNRWFYRNNGIPEWDEAAHEMAKLEMLQELIEDFLDYAPLKEIIEELKDLVKKSKVYPRMLEKLSVMPPGSGIPSSELADLLKLNRNSLTNRYPELEKHGLIVRTRRGKNSYVHITMTGRELAASMGLINQEIDISTEENTYKDPIKEEHPIYENFNVWAIQGQHNSCTP